MSIRRGDITRLNEARKASVPVIGKGKPLNRQGDDGDLTFRRTSDGLKLYIKATGKWHGVSVGESFESLEKTLKKLESKVTSLKKFKLPLTYETIGNFTLDSSGDITLDADGGQVYIKDGGVSHFEFDCASASLKIHDDTDATDWFRILVSTNGQTRMTTYDNDGTGGAMTLEPDGDLTLDPDSNNVVINATDKLNFDSRPGDGTYIQESADDVLSIYVGGDEFLKLDESVDLGGTLTSQGSLMVKERVMASADVAGQGQVWVKSSTPNELCFTDDAGTDIVGIGKYFYDVQRIGYNSLSTGNYIPMTGYVVESTSLSSANERLAFIAPYNGTIHQVQWRTEIAQDGTTSFRILESTDGTEVPGIQTCRVDETIDIADDTTHTVDLSSVTGDVNLDKGRIYAFYISHPTAPQDTNVTAVFKWDLTS